jgi:hypothetical protein
VQSATHLLAGILIQRATDRVQDASLRRTLVASLGVLSHGALDKVARMTYHPPEPRPNDPFWAAYHTALYALSAFLLIANYRPYKRGMFWAAAPDLDWVARWVARRLPWDAPLWSEPILHNALHGLVDALPGLNRLSRLPDWRTKQGGALVEFALLALLATLIGTMEGRVPDAP